MNIIYTLNDKFVPQVAAGITSVCENNKERKDITFYIVSSGISKSNKKELKKLVKIYNRKIEIIELEKLNNYFDFEFDTNGWNPIVLSRLLIDKLIPKKVDKILYLDGDTIVRRNLDDLYDIDLGNKVLGMSIEPTIDKKRIENLNMGDYPYCNAGVLLIDMKNWKKNKAGERVIKFLADNNGRLFANDQDAINGSLKEEIMILSPKYNFYNIYNQYSYSFLKRIMKPNKYIDKEIFEDAKREPAIIHYLGEERPWRKGNTHKYRKDYKKYLNMTAWKDTKDENGWRLYFICWRIFNIITKPFPLLRYKIINSLIPTFMKIRKNKLKKEKK